MDIWLILRDVVMLLAACLLAGGVASRLGQSPIIGYLLAGMFLGGPGSIGAVESEEAIEGIAELGVALLLFSLGLEFSVQRLKRVGARPLMGGVLQVVITIALASGVYLLVEREVKPAIAFGVMVCLSSTAVVLRILMERSELDMPHGRNSLAVLLTQDMAVVPLALVMTLLGGEGSASDVAMDVGKLLLLAGALVVGFMILNKIAVLALGTLTLMRNRELTVIFAVVAGLGAAWAAHWAGVSPALGAFVAGMLLGSSAFATQIRADVSSLRVLLLTLFFGAAGMVADPVWIVQNWLLVAGVSVALAVGKLVIVWLIFRALGHTTRVAAASGLALAQVGEFAFVLGSIGRANGVVDQELYALVISVTIVSFFLTALLVPAAPRFGNLMARLLHSKQSPTESGQDGSDAPPAALIIGFGPAGQIAARPFVEQADRVVVIDLNQQGVRQATELGFRGIVGDATQSDVLEHLHLSECRVVVVTVPHHESAMTIVEQVRQHAPQAHVVARSRYQMHAEDLATTGAHVVGDEKEVGRSLARHLRQWLSEAGEEEAEE